MISYSTYQLRNGLRLLHHYDEATQMVAVNLLYDVGARDESPERTGLAHLMEHLMFTGSAHAQSFDGPLQDAGGSSNAWTSCDMTYYYETLPAHNVETAFWLEADRLLHLNLSDESISTQKSVVIEEFKQRFLNQPYGDVTHLTNALTYKVHPYRWPVIGLTVDDIQNASNEEIRSFFEQHYCVNNLVLCVSGHVDFETTVALAEKWFGGIEPRALSPRSIAQEPVQTEPRFEKVHRDVPNDMIYMGFHMCGRGDADYQACDLLSDVLSNGQSSRLYRNVLMKTGLFTELDAAVSGTHDPGLFIVRAMLAPDASFSSAQAAIDAELDHFLSTGPTAYEIEKCVNKWESTQLFENVGYDKKALRLCLYQHLGDVAEVNHEIEKYRSLTPERVLDVAKQILRPDNCSKLYYGKKV